MSTEPLPNDMPSNGIHPSSQTTRAEELETLLKLTLAQIIPFIKAADDEATAHLTTPISSPLQSSLHPNQHPPTTLSPLLSSTLHLPSTPGGPSLFTSTLTSLLSYSVNTSSPGFLDKLYSAPLPPSIVADLILSVLNTNVHIYSVSPVLTLIEKHVTKSLASLFGFTGSRAGGISVQGGSAANLTSMIIARNTLFPRTKIHGNGVDGLKLVVVTSKHGHYSVEKAAGACGLGTEAVVSVAVDVEGRMRGEELERVIVEEREKGRTPFWVNVTSGTTVVGAFDPIEEVGEVAKRYGLWVHVDAAWGGGFVFSERLKRERLKGVAEWADSVAVNPHKMMGVPVTCSFLLARDLRQFHEANTLRAGYLFHDDGDEEVEESNGVTEGIEEVWKEPNDLADMTLQCGRRGDSLKLFMAWQYYGTDGYRDMIEKAYDVACEMVRMVAKKKNFILISEDPPPCLQVCFYYAPEGKMVFGEEQNQISPLELQSGEDKAKAFGKLNSKVTERVTKLLVSRGFMIDFAPALEGQEHRGKFFRAVVNISTSVNTIERLIHTIEELGTEVVQGLKEQYRC